MSRKNDRCYCAFCRTERTVYRKGHISFIDTALSLVASLTLMFAIWQDFDARVFVIVAFALGFSEIFVLIRWRMSVMCSTCGFDPVLYKRNQQAAADKVSNWLNERKNDPRAWLKPMPKLPHRKAKSKVDAGLPAGLPAVPVKSNADARLSVHL